MLTEEKIKAIVPTAPKNVGVYIPFINNAFEKFEINTIKRQAAFIAQVAHESGGFHFVKELASGKNYDTGSIAKALGNTLEADGDGQLFKGRGLIQITGRRNYEACSMAIFGDKRLLKTPELLETPEYAVHSAAWFWNANHLNKYADSDDFVGLTKRINGGINGIEERTKYWKLAMEQLR